MNNGKEGGSGSARRDRIIQMSKLKGDETFSQFSRSEYSMEDVLDQAQFRQLSKEIQMEGHQQQRLVDSFYRPQWKQNSFKFQRKIDPPSVYSEEYSKWKGNNQQDDAFKSTYASTLALLSKQQQRVEVDRLLKEYEIDRAIFSYSHQNPLSHINQQYTNKVTNLTAKQFQITSQLKRPQQEHSTLSNNSFKPDPIKKWQQAQVNDNLQKKQAIIELQVQQHLLQKLKQINQQQKRDEAKAKKQKQLKRTCFKDLIQHPPNHHQKSFVLEAQKSPQKANILKSNSISHWGQVSQQNESIKNKKYKKEAEYRLNVEEILKIPYRLFLIFYSDNYHQIVRLSSTEDLKRINNYRTQALMRQQALQKLKRKVAEEGSQIVSKLPSQMKQKLFKVLYDQDLQEERYAQLHE